MIKNLNYCNYSYLFLLFLKYQAQFWKSNFSAFFSILIDYPQSLLTRQLDGAALCAVSSSLQHLASHVSAWPQRSNLKQGPMWDSVDKSNASELPYPQSRTARQWSWLQCDSVRDRVLRAFPTLHVHPIQNTSISAWDVIYYSSSPPLDYTQNFLK